MTRLTHERTALLTMGTTPTVMKRCAAALCLLLSTAASAATPLPQSFTARFSVTAKGITVARSDWQLKPAGSGHYVYQSQTEATGIVALFHDERVTERSEWTYHDGRGIRPLTYSYRRSGGKKDKEVHVRFDWQKKTAYNTADGKSWPMRVPEGTQDKLTYLLALMRDLEAGKRHVTYTIADGGKLKTYRLEVIGQQRLETALGPLRTLEVRRIRHDDERETTIWCASSLHYLPVKVVHREKSGTDVLLEIESVQGLGPQVSRAGSP